jgi:hypothetical protein
MDKEIKSDPTNYRIMSEPFETPEKANEALKAFNEELSELRKKHKISDLLYVIKDSCYYPDGEIGYFMQHSHFGDILQAEAMAAYLYGKEQSETRERMNKLINSKK